MHEFALADAVMRAALSTAQTEGLTRLTAIHLKVGELQQIKKDVFEFALQETRPADAPALRDTVVTVEIEPATFRCRACEHEFLLAEASGAQADDEREAIHFVPELAHAFMKCPTCSSPDFEIVGGRGVSIDSLEGERDDA